MRAMFDHFDMLAPWYDRLMGPPDIERLADLLKLPSTGWLLDGGGGTGRASAPLRQRVGRVVVSDLSERMLRQAAPKSLNRVRARAEQLPFRDGTFDRILVVDALHHFDDQPAAIRAFARTLRPGGRILIEEFDAGRRAVRLIALAEKVFLMRSRFLSPARIRELLDACGLKSHVADASRFAAWIVGDKP
jgi:demethylmenaquinone methyltransferase/2-methoxy-6-polyprenyl-1,4-benzoquinol methylase